MKFFGGKARALMTQLYCLSLLVSCSALPRIVPDMVQHRAEPVQLDGSQGPLSVARSKAIIEQLKTRGTPSSFFDLHLAIEQAVVASPLTVGNRVELLQNGPQTYQAMLAAINSAQDHINMETYILDDDEVGQQFASALIARQRQGVRVNLIRDSVGTLGTPSAFFSQLTASGIQGWSLIRLTR